MADSQSTIKVRVDKSHLLTLGEKMYRESIEFVRELVNNAYDADATEVRVLIAGNRIEVADNGSGMNKKGLEQFFTIGSDEKRIHGVSPRFGRKRIGQFGIGKFSALALAERFTVESVKGAHKYAVVFDRGDWQARDEWTLPIVKLPAGALDREGTRIILDKLTKNTAAREAEKYLKQSVPLRAKKFSVFLNNKKITAKTVPGRAFPVRIKTMYGLVEGEIIVALNPGDLDVPGVECRVKEVLIKREFFGLERKHSFGLNRITGSVNADFLPLLSSRTDFQADAPETRLFYQLLRAELEKTLLELKKQSETKNLEKVTRELQNIMKRIREALLHNPDFIPQGRAVSRLKEEAKKRPPAASAVLNPKKPGKTDEKPETEPKKTEPETEKAKKTEPQIDAAPLVMKKIKLTKFGVSCGIVSLGEDGPEALSQGNMVYINQDHPTYRRLYKKSDLLSLHLARLVTQEIVLMKKSRITAREAFDWQSKLLRDVLNG